MRTVNKLTDSKIKNFKLETDKKQSKLSDGEGLYLLVKPSGKYWRHSYRFAGKQKTIAHGAYPKISLKEARILKNQDKQALQDGSDPAHKRKLDKLAINKSHSENFESIALEFAEINRNKWSKVHFDKFTSRLRNHAFPWIGNRPIAEITAPELLAVIRRIEAKGKLHTVSKVKQHCGQVFRFGISTGRCERDVSADLKGALKPEIRKNYAFPTDPQEIGGLLRAIEGYKGEYSTRCALKILPMIFVRSGELRHAEWCEVNLDTGRWIIPKGKMKSKRDHVVPLAQQVIHIISDLQNFTQNGKYLFPSIASRNRAMSGNTLNTALKRMGYTSNEIVPHGFRHMASTLLHEQGFNTDWIEMQLAHVDGSTRGVYNKAQYINERTAMMQQWANYLDSLKSGEINNVVPIKKYQ